MGSIYNKKSADTIPLETMQRNEIFGNKLFILFMKLIF